MEINDSIHLLGLIIDDLKAIASHPDCEEVLQSLFEKDGTPDVSYTVALVALLESHNLTVRNGEIVDTDEYVFRNGGWEEIQF